MDIVQLFIQRKNNFADIFGKGIPGLQFQWLEGVTNISKHVSSVINFVSNSMLLVIAHAHIKWCYYGYHAKITNLCNIQWKAHFQVGCFAQTNNHNY